jgi:hypothetical protein
LDKEHLSSFARAYIEDQKIRNGPEYEKQASKIDKIYSDMLHKKVTEIYEAETKTKVKA